MFHRNGCDTLKRMGPWIIGSTCVYPAMTRQTGCCLKKGHQIVSNLLQSASVHLDSCKNNDVCCTHWLAEDKPRTLCTGNMEETNVKRSTSTRWEKGRQRLSSEREREATQRESAEITDKRKAFQVEKDNMITERKSFRRELKAKQNSRRAFSDETYTMLE